MLGWMIGNEGDLLGIDPQNGGKLQILYCRSAATGFLFVSLKIAESQLKDFTLTSPRINY